MKIFIRSALATAILLTGSVGAFAQPYQDQRRDEHHDERRDDRHDDRRVEEHHYEQHGDRRYESVQEHDGWRRGGEMRREDWDHGRRFDYHEYGLRQPPYGYEWREVGGVFVLGAIATGVIADILLNAR